MQPCFWKFGSCIMKWGVCRTPQLWQTFYFVMFVLLVTLSFRQRKRLWLCGAWLLTASVYDMYGAMQRTRCFPCEIIILTVLLLLHVMLMWPHTNVWYSMSRKSRFDYRRAAIKYVLPQIPESIFQPICVEMSEDSTEELKTFPCLLLYVNRNIVSMAS